MDRFVRNKMVLGTEKMKKLSGAKVAVFGIGGVGGYVVEALARSGIGALVLVDHDTVSQSNINRQILATDKTIGMVKVDVMKERISDINPYVSVETRKRFFLPENADEFDFSEYSYVVDAVDTVTAKLAIIMKAKESGVPVISSMGTGNKLDPTKLQIADIYQTSMCPLAKVMRHECKKRGITDLKVVFSTEEPVRASEDTEDKVNAENTEEIAANALADDRVKGEIKSAARKDIPGSMIFVPATAGLIIASEVVKDLIEYE